MRILRRKAADIAMVVYFLQYRGDGEEFIPFLSPQRLERLCGVSSAGVRRQTVFSYALLRLALFEQYGIAQAPEFEYGEREKPFLKDFPSVFFSISHSGQAVLCAADDFPLGADLQEVRGIKLSAAEKFCSREELSRLSGNTDRELCRLWCVKESYAKFTGRGFAEGFAKIPAEALLQEKRAVLTERDGYFISVCADRKISPPELIETDESALLRRLNEICEKN